MSKAIYTGVDGVAHKVKKMYIGVDGVARKVKKAYIGVDGIARQFFSSGTLVVHPTVALTANSSNGYVVSASTEYSSTYAAWKAFNKDYSNGYCWRAKSSDSAPQITIKLPKPICVTKVKIANATASTVNGVISANVNGSNDGNQWTCLCNITGRDGSTSGLLTEHQMTSSDIAYQYIRIYPLTWYKNGSHEYAIIGEIYIEGIEPD